MSVASKLKTIVLGKSMDPKDTRIFHKLSLIAFFAWVGFGADGLSSSCYGPQEAFLALQGHTYLSIFVALGTVFTIFIISASYSQIIELFPSGGGGYLVASKLLSPATGMVSGCALLIDYVLTITVSVASGADAVFSLLPLQYHSYRLTFAICVLVILVVLNMRGVKDSILPLVPIFLTFVVTHVFIILYAIFTHLPSLNSIAASTTESVNTTMSSMGFFGMMFLILKAYSMGAGTYTGIEAVSNGVPFLREPRVHTAKHTMRYMAISLAFVAMGLMLAYLFFEVGPQPGKTLNAILFEKSTGHWKLGYVFVFVALFSEAALLFVAAQAGFLDGPRVLANMAVDRWFPTKFSILSNRLVIRNGVIIMGGLSLIIMLISHGSVKLLVVLYSINVFITFVLSQLGMVRHWWISRAKVRGWYKKILINGIGLVLCIFILSFMIIFKFYEGGWITLLITGALVILAVMIRRHYMNTAQVLNRLNDLVSVAEVAASEKVYPATRFDPKAKTAILFVNGFNGMGLHTLFGIIRLFGGTFRNFIFIQVGIIDVGNFKGVEEVGRLTEQTKSDVGRYAKFIQKQGMYAEGISLVGVDVVSETKKIIPDLTKNFPNAVIFGGQLVFPKESLVTRLLHNYTVFDMQRMFYRQGIPFIILPIRV